VPAIYPFGIRVRGDHRPKRRRPKRLTSRPAPKPSAAWSNSGRRLKANDAWFFADLEQTIKRPLSDGEISATGGLVLGDRLPKERRKAKRSLRRAREEARLVDLGLKAKGK
jgi:hypothetical protein